MSTIINILGRDGDRVAVKITFLDESGHGLERVWVTDNSGGIIFAEVTLSPECPPTYEATVPDLRVHQFPIFGHSAYCGAPDAVESIGFGAETVYEVHISPIPEENPCSPYFGSSVVETEESTRIRNLINTYVENVQEIADEIAALCAERNSMNEELGDLNTRKTAFTAAASVALLVSIVLIAALPWPFSYIGLAVLAAALALFAVAAAYEQRADRLAREIDTINANIEDARRRYAEAVAEATRANCGPVYGLETSPPTCS